MSENLSDKRGNSFGIGFFHLFLNIFGANRACEFVWVIALFYVLFDTKARKAAESGIRHIFPDAGPFKRFLKTWAMFTRQGQVIIEAEVMRQEKMNWTFVHHEYCKALEADSKGFILLASHFGSWQSLIGGLKIVERNIFLLAAPDQNANIDKMTAGEALRDRITQLSTADPMGSLPAVAEALQNGAAVCMMGDRCLEDHGVPVSFFGEIAHFPAAAFFLAARTGCAVLPLFALPGKDHYHLIVRYCKPIYPVMRGRSRDQLSPFAEIYAKYLEFWTRKYPSCAFIFDDPWK